MSDTRSLQRAFVTDLESSDADRCFDCRHSAILGYPDATCTCLSIPLEEPMRSRCPGHELPPDELRAELDRLRRERDALEAQVERLNREREAMKEVAAAAVIVRDRALVGANDVLAWNRLDRAIKAWRGPDAKEQGDDR